MASAALLAKFLVLSFLLITVSSSPGSASNNIDRVVPGGTCMGYCKDVAGCVQECRDHGFWDGACFGNPRSEICCCSE